MVVKLGDYSDDGRVRGLAPINARNNRNGKQALTIRPIRAASSIRTTSLQLQKTLKRYELTAFQNEDATISHLEFVCFGPAFAPVVDFLREESSITLVMLDDNFPVILKVEPSIRVFFLEFLVPLDSVPEQGLDTVGGSDLNQRPGGRGEHGLDGLPDFIRGDVLSFFTDCQVKRFRFDVTARTG